VILRIHMDCWEGEVGLEKLEVDKLVHLELVTQLYLYGLRHSVNCSAILYHTGKANNIMLPIMVTMMSYLVLDGSRHCS